MKYCELVCFNLTILYRNAFWWLFMSTVFVSCLVTASFAAFTTQLTAVIY